MAARKQLFHPDDVKAKIKTSQLLNRLQDNGLADQEFLTVGQIQSIRAVLAKVIPDVKAIEITGEVEHGVTSELAALMEAVNGRTRTK